MVSIVEGVKREVFAVVVHYAMQAQTNSNHVVADLS